MAVGSIGLVSNSVDSPFCGLNIYRYCGPIFLTQIFQKPLIEECSLNHVWVLTMIQGTLIHHEVLEDL